MLPWDLGKSEVGMYVQASSERDWETTFRAWKKPSSDSEQERCENAERMIKEAIDESPALARRTITVFAQGSYRNNTNVRLDSDVDICVLCTDSYFPDYAMADGASAESTGFVPASYAYSQFKDEVGAALVKKFGTKGVKRGPKAFDVHENGYRVDADVVACFEHRRYTVWDRAGLWLYESGTQFIADTGQKIINWPEQHYTNGVGKNARTGNRFKFLTRALKRLRNEMNEKGIAAAAPIPSYLIECLVWNVPDDYFGSEEYVRDMRQVLMHTFNCTLDSQKCGEWGEVNELKYLFHQGQPWTMKQAHDFLDAAWDYVGYE